MEGWVIPNNEIIRKYREKENYRVFFNIRSGHHLIKRYERKKKRAHQKKEKATRKQTPQ